MTCCNDVHEGRRTSPSNFWIVIAVAAAPSCFREDGNTRFSKRGFVRRLVGEGLTVGSGCHCRGVLVTTAGRRSRCLVVTNTPVSIKNGHQARQPGRGAEQSGSQITDQGQGLRVR